MNQGIQSTLKNKNIKDEGCYFLALIQSVRPDFTEQQINDLYEASVKLGLMRRDCFVLKPCDILRALTREDYSVSIGATPDADIAIAANNNGKYTHFTLEKPEKWDSLPPDRPAAKTYRVVDYRLFRKI